jgi:O6-methylguanine-DNA--protein-cysteine methyltransferase
VRKYILELELKAIAYGQTSSYLGQALGVGNDRAFRALANAGFWLMKNGLLKKN